MLRNSIPTSHVRSSMPVSHMQTERRRWDGYEANSAYQQRAPATISFQVCCFKLFINCPVMFEVFVKAKHFSSIQVEMIILDTLNILGFVEQLMIVNEFQQMCNGVFVAGCERPTRRWAQPIWKVFRFYPENSRSSDIISSHRKSFLIPVSLLHRKKILTKFIWRANGTEGTCCQLCGSLNCWNMQVCVN